ncbi:hypothetical protein GE061_001406 [Apolygus lucorum]|uniref:Uncharacterized protein n=1 Tax=Apolygus lucorum TaxID=248454 RepID=A0A8S9Y796_APOLU|nr:hypothetical protein GE061_001406 [Apolygus lucorum]
MLYVSELLCTSIIRRALNGFHRLGKDVKVKAIRVRRPGTITRRGSNWHRTVSRWVWWLGIPPRPEPFNACVRKALK